MLLVENADASFTFTSKYGEKSADSPLLMASITKLFAASCILILREQGKLSFDDKLTKYFTASILNGLHIYKDKSIYRPKFIMCNRASGGCISTARDLMLFLKAFFSGRLFDKNVLSLTDYRNMQTAMSPMRYGCGHMQIPLDGVATLFQGKGSLAGHSGSTGSFAFYYPQNDLFFVGDANQMANPAIPIRLAIQLAMTV